MSQQSFINLKKCIPSIFKLPTKNGLMWQNLLRLTSESHETIRLLWAQVSIPEHHVSHTHWISTETKIKLWSDRQYIIHIAISHWFPALLDTSHLDSIKVSGNADVWMPCYCQVTPVVINYIFGMREKEPGSVDSIHHYVKERIMISVLT